jgi:hypothetical protein
MLKPKTMFRFALIISLMLNGSCLKVPIELDLSEKIEISTQKISDIAEQIYEILAEIDFSSPASCPENDCRAAYKIWLRKQFNNGLVPKGLIGPLEYGASGISANPAISTCRHIDFEAEYEKATEKNVRTSKREAVIFRLNDFRNKISSNKCTDNFIDPDQEKITIDEINLHVLKNTLSVSSPIFNLYTSDEEVTKDELEEIDAESNLIKDGILYHLTQTKKIPPRFTGILPTNLESDPQKFSDAEVPIVALDGTIIAIPSMIAGEPESKTVAGKDYFVVPTGSISLRLTMRVSVKAKLSDAKCAYEQFKDSIKKEEEERKKNE